MSEKFDPFSLDPRESLAEINLNEYASLTLLSPFGKMNSVPRLDMVNNAFKHCVVPVDPEPPLVDSSYTNDILVSTDNKYETNGCKLLYTIPKMINGTLCETCYIYEDLGTNTVKLEIVPRYQLSHKFGYPMTSDFANMKPGEVKEGKVHTKYYDFYDNDNSVVSFGKNIRFIYNISRDVGEDSIVVNESLARRFSKIHQDVVEFTISPDYILRNLHGDEDEYKPIPLPGDKIPDGIIASMYIDDSKAFIAYDDESKLESDINYMVQDNIPGEDVEVLDIEIFSKDVINIPSLEKARLEYREYLREILKSINEVIRTYDRENIHYSLNNIKNKYTLILNSSDLRWGTDELNNNIAIRISTISKRPLMPGSKLTNRHGGKGTVALVVPDGTMVSEYGDEIEMMINSTGVFNRENMGQLPEKQISEAWYYLQRWFKNSGASYEEMKEKLIGFLRVIRQPTSADYLEQLDAKTLMEYYIDNDIYTTYKPYDDRNEGEFFNTIVSLQTTAYIESFCDTTPPLIYYNGVPMSQRHDIGKAFYMILANGPEKDTSIRSDDGTNAKGNPTKISKDRKKHHTKFGSTSVKQSDFALSNFINPMYEQDKLILANNSTPFHDYMQAMGVEIIFVDDEGEIT